MSKLNVTSPVAVSSPGTVTIAASVGGAPSVVSKATHGLLAGTPLTFTAGTSLPTGMTTGTVYTVAAGSTLLTNSFTLLDPQGNAVNCSDTGVGTITATCTDVVATINVSGARVLGCEVKNVGANPLDLFDVYARFTELGNWQKVSTAGTDYTNAVYPITKASASPVALAASASMWFFMDVTGMDSVQLRASSSAGATSLELHASAKFVW